MRPKPRPSRPTRTLAEARERFAALAARDDARISLAGRSRLVIPRGRRERLAVVLLHGFTSAPEQWALFTAELARSDVNVVVPRLDGHGYADLQTSALARATVDDWLRTTAEALDIASGLAERVAVGGLSLGATLALHAALDRPDLARAVAVSPLLGLAGLGPRRDGWLAAALGALPNAFLPWDPGGGDAQIPAYAYPRFPTRALAGSLRLGLSILRRALRGEAPTPRVHFLLNAAEPACDNALPSRVNACWATANVIVQHDLPHNHDVIDPSNALERIARVYPRVQAALLG